MHINVAISTHATGVRQIKIVQAYESSTDIEKINVDCLSDILGSYRPGHYDRQTSCLSPVLLHCMLISDPHQEKPPSLIPILDLRTYVIVTWGPCVSGALAK